MKTYSHLTIAILAAVTVQVQSRPRGGPRAFSVSQSINLGPDKWVPESETSGDSRETITYNSIDMDTTEGWIDKSKGEFVAPNKGVYRFTFTASVFCPPKTECIGEVSIEADGEVLAKGHEVNANFGLQNLHFFVCSNITAEKNWTINQPSVSFNRTTRTSLSLARE